MMKTFIFTNHEIAKAYKENFLEILNDTATEFSSLEIANDAIQFGCTLKSILDPKCALETIRSRMKDGCTLLMLPLDQKDEIEKYGYESKDFRFAIFDEQGNPIGIINEENIIW